METNNQQSTRNKNISISKNNDETQILFPDFDDTPPILYHGPELTNTDLLFTLPWLNISNLK